MVRKAGTFDERVVEAIKIIKGACVTCDVKMGELTFFPNLTFSPFFFFQRRGNTRLSH
jgi:hypothetical protein